MTDYRRQLSGLIGALYIVLPDRFTWFGERSNIISREARETIDPETRRHYLVAAVRAYLYGRFYLPGYPIPASDPSAPPSVVAGGPFVKALIEANAGAGCWQPGWSIVERADGGAWVQRDGLTVWSPDELYRELSSGPEANQNVSIRTSKGSTTRSPGFYLAQSSAPFQLSRSEILVRLYWHLTSGGASKLMSLITNTLDADRVPFQFKVLYDPGSYKRNDAGVLYLAKDDLHRAAAHLEDIYRAIQLELLPGEPALTKQLAPGLGLAEDPGDSESFGTHRCGILAEAFVKAAEQSITASSAVLELIDECFRNEGLDLDYPYLSRGSVDDYDRIVASGSWKIADFSPPTLTTISDVTDEHDPATVFQTFVEAASAIGDRLVDSAIWYDGRCTWLGELESDAITRESGRTAGYGAIGPDVYSGTAGIAFFLAQLAAETGSERFSRTARGAIEQAIHTLDRLPDHGRLGFYSGWPGIAVVSAAIGRINGDLALQHDVPGRLTEDRAGPPRPAEPDILAGTAGTVLAFLLLARLTADERYLARAVELGDGLITTAKSRGASMWWPVDTGSGRRGLTGFAHGAAGIAYAFLELFTVTGEPRLRAAMDAGFDFERRNFSQALGNWLDLRYPVAGSRFGPAAVAANAWCHGAAGILISRLSAWDLLGDERSHDEAGLALQSMLAWFDTEPGDSPARWCLCHGFAGNADILNWASALLPDQSHQLRRLAERTGDAGLAVDQSAMEPGLMLGLAGLGTFYLRLANPSLPSPLIPATFAAALRG